MIGQPVGNRFFALGTLHGRPHAGVGRLGQAGCANRVDGGKLRFAQAGHAQRMRRRLGFFQLILKQRRAALNCGCRIV